MSSIVADYEDAFIRRAHELLGKGYKEAKNRFNATTEEEVISQFIVMAIEQYLKFDPRLERRFRRFSVSCEVPVNNTGLTGKRRKKIDIIIDTDEPRPGLKFICEAKRLRADSHPASDYTGEGGLLCFLNEEYAVDYSFAAMLGYVQSHDFNYWFGALKKRFEDPKNTHLQITSPLTSTSIIPDILQEWAKEWISTHNRKTLAPIQIYHILLECI